MSALIEHPELIEQASCEIAEYNATEAGLAALRARMANVHYDCSTVKGMIVAKADRAEVRGLRTGLENMRKQIKAPALAHCNLIDAEAKRITAALLALETPIDAQIKAREQVLENERLAREQAERDRINIIHGRIADIRCYHAAALERRTAVQVQELLDKLAAIELTGFDEFEDEAKAARITTMESMEKLLDQKREAEAEAAKLQAEQAAAVAQLAKERAELAEAREELAKLQAKAKAAADEIARNQPIQAVTTPVNELPTPVIAEPAAPVMVRRPPPTRTAPVAAQEPAPVVARVYAEHAPSSSEIYAMCCESATADKFVKWLCAQAGVAFPPVNEGVSA